MKKIVSLFLAMMMVLSLATMTASAAETGSITITDKGNVTVEAQTFTAYRLFNLSWDGGANYTYTPNTKYNALYTAFAAAHGDIALLAALEHNSVTDDSAAVDAIGTWLRNWLLTNSIVPDVSVVGDTDGEAVMDNLPLGYYLVLGTAVAEDGSIITAAVTLTTTDYHKEIDVKADAPTLTKKVWDVADAGAGETHSPTWQDVTDIYIGQKATFKLESAVPDHSKFTTYRFRMHDTMQVGLTFDASSVKVFLGGTADVGGTPVITGGTLLTAGTDYNVIAPGQDVDTTVNGATFSVDFLKIKDYTADTKLYVIFEAELNAAAAVYDPGNKNTAWLEYSNNPYAAGTGETTPDTVVVYTFGLDILKYAANPVPDAVPARLPLGGAKFNVYTQDSTNAGRAPLNLVRLAAGDDTTSAVYRVAASTDLPATIVTEIVTPDSGLIKVLGIDEGIHYLKETVAPDGFKLLEDDVVITTVVAYTFPENAYTGAPTDLIDWDIDASNIKSGTQALLLEQPIGILNQSGEKLPGTGGIGTTIFTIAGSALMVLAGVVLVVRRKRASDK